MQCDRASMDIAQPWSLQEEAIMPNANLQPQTDRNVTDMQTAQCKTHVGEHYNNQKAVPYLHELREVHAHVLHKGRGAQGGVGCHMDAILLGPVPHMLIPVMRMHLHLPAEMDDVCLSIYLSQRTVW